MNKKEMVLTLEDVSELIKEMKSDKFIDKLSIEDWAEIHNMWVKVQEDTRNDQSTKA